MSNRCPPRILVCSSTTVAIGIGTSIASVNPQAQHADNLRFAFGRNWNRFLKNIDDSAVELAEESLREMLNVDSLEGKTFLDVGCGSGLFSLAARRLGATVASFDVDDLSVAAAVTLRAKYLTDDSGWRIERGSVLDREYLDSLGTFDIVYSWGVLHHTGAMWEAIQNTTELVRPGGVLFIALYNDQGGRSRRWRTIKRLYNQFAWLRGPLIIGSAIKLQWRTWLKRLLTLSLLLNRNKHPVGDERGMLPWTDIIDWVGGYPFEVSTPDEVVAKLHAWGFQLMKLRTRQGIGNNEFVFRKDKKTPAGLARNESS